MKIVTLVSALVSLFFFIITGFFLGIIYDQGTLAIRFPVFPIITPKVTGNTYQPLKESKYIDDTIMLVTHEVPVKVLVAIAIRKVNADGSYNQDTQVSFFDGKNWKRRTFTQPISDTLIQPNNIIESWNIYIDPSKVLKQSAFGSLNFNNMQIGFQTNILVNEIPLRSLPSYTKFLSNGSGTLSVDKIHSEANVLYSRIYSDNASEIQVYDKPLGLTTDWLAFWDENGNFYHLDSSIVKKPTSDYQTHRIGIMEDNLGRVTRTFDVNITHDTGNLPSSINYILGNPVNRTITVSRGEYENKSSDGNSGVWIMGNVTGIVQASDSASIQGKGVMEYIHE